MNISVSEHFYRNPLQLLKTWERCHHQKLDASCSHFSFQLINSCLAFIIPKEERVSANPSEIRHFLDKGFCIQHSLSSFRAGLDFFFFWKQRLQRLAGSVSTDVCSASEWPARSRALLQLERCDVSQRPNCTQNSVVSSHRGSLLNVCCFEISAMEALNW